MTAKFFALLQINDVWLQRDSDTIRSYTDTIQNLLGSLELSSAFFLFHPSGPPNLEMRPCLISLAHFIIVRQQHKKKVAWH